MTNATEIRIIAQSDGGLRVCAAAGRISTQEGSALEIFDAADGSEKDLRLVKKVLSSGHKSVMEHHSFSVALQNVSVLVEQFLIEHRLAAFIVKSRRYVDFKHAGFFVPSGMSDELKQAYISAMQQRFTDYAALLELGIPKEDARFVLPYCFHSNFYLSCNARELVHIICAMRYGRGRALPEVRDVGEAIQTEFEQIYPGVVDQEKARYANTAVPPAPDAFAKPHVVTPAVALLDGPRDAQALLEAALAFTGRFAELPPAGRVQALTRDARPRELECLSYTYQVKDVSLASMTHYARHRIQSPLFPEVRRALAGGGYVLPETVAQSEQAMSVYQSAFEQNRRGLDACLALGLRDQDAAYFALAGCTADILITLNARELLHFLQLRTCERAQWEIRQLSESLLVALRKDAPQVFRWFGPSCAVQGKCPEGRMSCGRPRMSAAYPSLTRR